MGQGTCMPKDAMISGDARVFANKATVVGKRLSYCSVAVRDTTTEANYKINHLIRIGLQFPRASP